MSTMDRALILLTGVALFGVCVAAGLAVALIQEACR